jgi:hypothetical protein
MAHYKGEPTRPKKQAVRVTYTGYDIFLWKSDTDEGMYYYNSLNFRSHCELSAKVVAKIALALSRFPERFSLGVQITFKCYPRFATGTVTHVYDTVDYMVCKNSVLEDGSEWKSIQSLLNGCLDEQSFDKFDIVRKEYKGVIGKLTPLTNPLSFTRLRGHEPKSLFVTI